MIISTKEELMNLQYFQKFSYICVNCGKLTTIKSFRKNNIDTYSEFLCNKCLRIKRYGCVSPFERKDVQDKIKQHNLETLGVEYPLQSQKIHDTISENNLKKFGNKCTLHDGGICEAKTTKAFNDKYSVDYPLQNKEIYNKTRQSFKDKTGYMYSWENPETHAKTIDTIQNKYGVDNIMKLQEFREFISEQNKLHPEWHEDSMESNRNKRNGLLNSQTDEFKEYMSKYMSNLWADRPEFREFISEQNKLHPEWHEDSMESNRNNHGGVLYSQTEEFKLNLREQRILYPEKFQSKRLIYNGISFDSIPEFCVYVFCIYHWIPIIRNYVIHFDFIDIKGNPHEAYPDFIINGEFVEIKGAQFFNENDELYLLYRKPEWSDEEYKYKSSIYTYKGRCLLKNGVKILKDTDPWVQMCTNWVNDFFGESFTWQFSKNSFENTSHGYNPFNCDRSKEYQDPIGLGKTPFYIQNE